MLFKILEKKKIEDQELVKLGVMPAILQVIYIVLVAGLMILSQSLFKVSAGSMIIGMVSFLMLFVFSAGVSGFLIFGTPLYFALQKKYREAGIVLVSTALTMIAIFILLILGNLFIY